MRKAFSVRRRRAFTLIEILVVVAIIALLVGILIPSLKQARAQARALICGTHLNEIFKGGFMYSQGNNDYLPYFGYYTSRGGAIEGFEYEWWPSQIAKAVAYQLELFVCPDDEEPFSVSARWKGRKLEIPPQSWSHQDLFEIDISYRGSCDALEDTAQGTSPRKLTSWRHPDRAVLLIEANAQGLAGSECFRFVEHLSTIDDPLRIKAYPDLLQFRRHNGKSSFLFLDGHVERMTPEQAARLARNQEVELEE